MCKKNHEEWVNEFTLNQRAIGEDEKEKMEICWSYVHKPILRKYNLKDSNLKIGFLTEKILPENYVNFYHSKHYHHFLNDL